MTSLIYADLEGEKYAFRVSRLHENLISRQTLLHLLMFFGIAYRHWGNHIIADVQVEDIG